MSKKDKEIVEKIDDKYLIEGLLAREDRKNKRLFIALIVSLVITAMLISAVCGLVYYILQFEKVEETTTEEYYDFDVDQEADEDGVNNFIGRDGVVINGEAEN